MSYRNTFVQDSIDLLYRDLAYEILHNGEDVTARGLKFKEIRFIHAILNDPLNRIVTNPSRQISKKFAMAEFIWMMNGQDDLEMISYYNRRMKNFSDDDKILHGAYGPRLRNWPIEGETFGLDQIGDCLGRLQRDIYTRQAVIVILNPGRDFTVRTKDIPCNDLLQFMYREHRLDLACYVRSNDLLWGVPYDIFHWTMLQELFAKILKVPVGRYHHFVGSMHIYEKDYGKFGEIIRNTPMTKGMPEMPPHDDLSILKKLAQAEKSHRCGLKTKVSLPDYWKNLLSWLEM